MAYFSEYDMSCFYKEQLFSDLILIVNGEEIYAHKIVLVTRCCFFKTLLLLDPDLIKLSITNVSSKLFDKILKYLYTGKIELESLDAELVSELLKLVHFYSLKNLEAEIIKNTSTLLATSNVFDVLNKAYIYDMEQLVPFCHRFIFCNILDFENFNCLSQTAMERLLKDCPLQLPEIQVFEIVSKWCKSNNDDNNKIKNCIRLEKLTQEEILNVVWPSKLIDNEQILSTLACLMKTTSDEPKEKEVEETLFKVEETNDAGHLLRASTFDNEINIVSISSNEENNGVTTKVSEVDLGSESIFNQLEIFFGSQVCNYVVKVSTDSQRWHKIVDFKEYNCFGKQNLYFDKQCARYIKIFGTCHESKEKIFVTGIHVYINEDLVEAVDPISRPLLKIKICDVRVWSMLKNSKVNASYCCHYLPGGASLVELAQPYLISTIKFVLKKDCLYKYFVETSLDQENWEIVADRRNQISRDVQSLSFNKRPVKFIRITGTFPNEYRFECFCFECF